MSLEALKKHFWQRAPSPSLGILIRQAVLSNNSINTTRLGEGAAEQSAACGVHRLRPPPSPHHGDGYNLLLTPRKLLWRGDALYPCGSRMCLVSQEGIFIPHILLPAQQPRPWGANGPVAPRISPTCHPVNYLLANPA